MILKWLYPGMRVKRWVALCIVGTFLVSAGITAVAGVEVFAEIERRFLGFIEHVTGALPMTIMHWAGVLVILLGAALFVFGFRRMLSSLIGAAAPGVAPRLADVVYEKRYLKRGPRIVVIGGGTGLATLLRGLKEHTSNLTAIVAVSDDGGSSGRLRNDLGMPPPGDIRNTLLALADVEPLMEDLFDHRFGAGQELVGHSFGNLLIAAMTEVTGDFEAAVRASSRVLAIRGQVLPGTLESVTLQAEFEDGTQVAGESSIPLQGKPIRRVSLVPANAKPPQEAVRAIAEADLIVIGPGSLYTSVLPNLLITEIASAIHRSAAPAVYVCNVMTQPGETSGYSVADHVRAIVDHTGPNLFSYVLMNDAPIPISQIKRYEREGAAAVKADPEAVRRLGLTPIRYPLISNADLVRHDSKRLAEAVLNILETDLDISSSSRNIQTLWSVSRRGETRRRTGERR